MRTISPLPRPALSWWLVTNVKRDHFGIMFDVPMFFVLATSTEHAEIIACVILDMGPADFRMSGQITWHGNEETRTEQDPAPALGLPRPLCPEHNTSPANLD